MFITNIILYIKLFIIYILDIIIFITKRIDAFLNIIYGSICCCFCCWNDSIYFQYFTKQYNFLFNNIEYQKIINEKDITHLYKPNKNNKKIFKDSTDNLTSSSNTTSSNTSSSNTINSSTINNGYYNSKDRSYDTSDDESFDNVNQFNL